MQSLTALIQKHAVDDGETVTPIEGLSLFRAGAPVPRVPGIYPPALCAVVQGAKRVYLNGEPVSYGPGDVLCASIPLPLEGEVRAASDESPVLGFLLRLDTPQVSKIVLEAESVMPLDDASASEILPGLSGAEMDEPLNDAMVRLLELLDDEAALSVLGTGRFREVVFAVLRSKAGPSLRAALGARRDISRAVALIESRYAESISVDELARTSSMSRPVFHRKFRDATGYSPMQFVKLMRLNHASMCLMRGMSVAEAAGAVGYNSATQFSREFSRQFGASPKRWVESYRQA